MPGSHFALFDFGFMHSLLLCSLVGMLMLFRCSGKFYGRLGNKLCSQLLVVCFEVVQSSIT